MYEKPLIVQPSGNVFLLDRLDAKGQVAEKILPFSDLQKCPEGFMTFSISPFSIWSAAAMGYKSQQIINVLKQYSHNELPTQVLQTICKYTAEFGTLKLQGFDDWIELEAVNEKVINKIADIAGIKDRTTARVDTKRLRFKTNFYLELKTILYTEGYFIIDLTNRKGKPLRFNLRNYTRDGSSFSIRDYQRQAFDSYIKYSPVVGGGGTIIMPPYSGKTLVGLLIIQDLQLSTLILTENIQSSERWKTEILDKTDLSEESISIFDDANPNCTPITLCTYSTAVSSLNILEKEEWGFIIYDDAHKLPAETYVNTIMLASERKLAMASTLVRADKKGSLVFALVGPKWYEVLPKTLERDGWLVPILCAEVRIPLPDAEKDRYDQESKPGIQRRIAGENSNKKIVFEQLWKSMLTKKVLIVSWYRSIAQDLSALHNIRLITGNIGKNKISQDISKYNTGEAWTLISTQKIERIDVRDIDILIALSYQQSSEREEYLRLGKLMASSKKDKILYFFSLVTETTVEEKDYRIRRRFLINYGYRFKIYTCHEVCEGVNIFEL